MMLKEFFDSHPQAALAFSGGVDSAYLLYMAKTCGAKVKAYFVKSAFQPRFELEDAKRLAGMLDMPLQVLSVDILREASVAQNPANRCYYCKKKILSAIKEAAQKDGYTLLLDGTNASDSAKERPGTKALAELAVRSPLKECGLSKEAVRAQSKQAGLFTWAKPAYACLATRVATGERITAEKLSVTERAEDFLAAQGFRDFRVRLKDGCAKIQLQKEDFPLFLQKRETVAAYLRPLYRELTLDLEARHAG